MAGKPKPRRGARRGGLLGVSGVQAALAAAAALCYFRYGGGSAPSAPPKETPPRCTDAEANCAAWAEQGECTANAAYMREHCALSCGICVDASRAQAAARPTVDRARRAHSAMRLPPRTPGARSPSRPCAERACALAPPRRARHVRARPFRASDALTGRDGQGERAQPRACASSRQGRAPPRAGQLPDLLAARLRGRLRSSARRSLPTAPTRRRCSRPTRGWSPSTICSVSRRQTASLSWAQRASRRAPRRPAARASRALPRRRRAPHAQRPLRPRAPRPRSAPRLWRASTSLAASRRRSATCAPPPTAGACTPTAGKTRSCGV